MKNIVLMGFMGSGKSSVGQKLGEILSLPFFDTDDIVEERAGQTIKKIFENQGETAFRALEKKVVAEIAKKEDSVIAVGGGAVLDPQNVKALKNKGILVYLKASPQVIWGRGKLLENRPLLQVTKREEEIKRLLCLREETYEKVADITIDTSNLSIEQIVREIKTRITANKGKFAEGRA